MFRSGCCFRQRQGNVFDFRPGHETQPVYKRSNIQRVLDNAAEWAAPVNGPNLNVWEQLDPLEPIRDDESA